MFSERMPKAGQQERQQARKVFKQKIILEKLLEQVFFIEPDLSFEKNMIY